MARVLMATSVFLGRRVRTEKLLLTKHGDAYEENCRISDYTSRTNPR